MHEQKKRLSLIHYDVVRERCESCDRERFHFVPIGTSPRTNACASCGAPSRVADMSDTAVIRLINKPNGDVVVVPLAG